MLSCDVGQRSDSNFCQEKYHICCQRCSGGKKTWEGSYKDSKGGGGGSETDTSSGLRQDEFFARKRE